MKLLLIDDNELDRQNVVRAFKKNQTDISIVEASLAKEGLAHFENADFDAVLLDYHLPDIDGFEVLKLISQHPYRHSAVIILTGTTASEELECNFIEAGAQDVLFKSEISHKHLFRAISHAKARYSLERQLQDSHKKLRLLAENDALTGLANRYYFDQSLRAAISRAKRQDKQLALLFLDLDNFKYVNDTLGHQTGDQLLTIVAQRLLNVVRAGDIVCRLGGDEFAILAHDFGALEEIHQLAERVLEEMQKPFDLANTEANISTSLGVATYPEAGENAMDLLKAADMAMYRSKNDGRNNYCLFSLNMQIQLQERMSIEKELRSLIPTDHFTLFYQPIIDAKTLEISGAEGLIRWQHPTQGTLPPSEFITIAEEIGLIGEIDSRSRKQACDQLAKWQKKGLVRKNFSMKINLCAQLLKDDELYEAITRDLSESGINGSSISLEITESVLIKNLATAAKRLQKIVDLGIEIAIDDFGTGYSSIAYLKELPTHTLKIDKTFVNGVPENAADCRILRALIIFAKSLDFTVVIEGIETLEQAVLCREFGADHLQGYLFSVPLDTATFENYLRNYNSETWLHMFTSKSAYKN